MNAMFVGRHIYNSTSIMTIAIHIVVTLNQYRRKYC